MNENQIEADLELIQKDSVKNKMHRVHIAQNGQKTKNVHNLKNILKIHLKIHVVTKNSY